MKNQEGSVNMDVENLLTTEDISTQSNNMTKKAQITTLVLNLLSTDSMIHSTDIHISEIKPCILCKQKFISHLDELIKEFTIVICGCLYCQKCLEGYILNIVKIKAKLMYSN